MSSHLHAEAKSPVGIKDVYKTFQKVKRNAIETCPDIVDLERRCHKHNSRIKELTMCQLPDELQNIWNDFIHRDRGEKANGADFSTLSSNSTTVFEVRSITGLFIYPSLLPPGVQLHLLNNLLHRDLCNPEHKTNIHLHYNVPYPNPQDSAWSTSYFDPSASGSMFKPKDPTIHKPLTTQQFLTKKLRWITLGGQYDWTNKVYPSGKPPAFPEDIKNLIESLFPMKAEAAIVNLYSPGDTLSLHRDVSEECDQPLVSISLGCDGIFVIGLDEVDEDDRARVEVIRLRSGDAVLMSGKSRYAWHGVPKVLEGTCPSWMADWPFEEVVDEQGGVERRFEEWRGWIKGKRVNLNVRQMFDSEGEG